MHIPVLYIVIGLVIALALGLLIGILIRNARVGSLKAELAASKAIAERLEAEGSERSARAATLLHEREEACRRDADARLALQRERFEKSIADLKDEHAQQKQELKEQFSQSLTDKDKANAAALAAQEERHQQALEALQARFDETMAKVSAQVRTATDDMLKERQKEFAESSNQNLGLIVNPLRETIDQMKKAMDDSALRTTAMTSEMKVSIENMMRQSQAAKESADELTRAFKHGSKVQGDWGETVLDELLQSQGLTKGIHYDAQPTMRDASGNTIHSADGNLLRPDIILHLDTRRELIIDSKVSLTAFMDYANAESEGDRQRFLHAHIESIQKHVKELSQKDYSSYITSPKVRMDYVIMFVPHTGALWTALNNQRDLWRKAMEKNVFIADEQTLFAALRIINLTWTQIIQAQNHEKVYALANEMLDRVGQFVKKYEQIGASLRKAQDTYDEAKRKLVPEGQSIINTAGKLIKLGAKQSDKNPIPQLNVLTEGPDMLPSPDIPEKSEQPESPESAEQPQP